MAKVLVTGGGGFIGSHLVDGLLGSGHDARILDNFATGRRENLQHVAQDVDVVEGDIQSYERVHNAVRGCEVILHQAALPSVPRSIQDPLTSAAVNVTGTLNVLLAARDEGVRRVVFASSSSVYGAAPGLPKVETMRPEPISPYAVAKLAAEGFCRSFSEVYGLETLALRYFNVFGPRQDPLSQYAAVIPNFITAAAQGRRLLIHGDGDQSRDFTFVENVVHGNLAAMDAPAAAGQVMNLACGDSISLNDLVEAIGNVLGRPIEAEHGPPRAGDVRHSRADNSRARDLLGWAPAVGFREGLERTVAAYAPASAVDRTPSSSR